MNTHMFVFSLFLALFAGLFTQVTSLPLGDLVVETRITPVYHLTSVAPKPQQFTNATFPGVAGSPSASSSNNKEIKVNPVPQAPPAPAPADNTDVSSPPAPAAPPPAAIYVAEYHPPSGPAPPGAPPASSAGDASSSSSSPSSPSSPSTKCRPDEPSIRVNNSSPHSICYMVEMSAAIGAGAPPSSITQDVACGPGSGFNVPAGGNIEFCPGAGFVGAVTAFRSSSSSASASGGPKRGSRVEFNFAAAANETYYDVDYEMGMDSCTVGPRSGRPRMLDGGARQLGSLAGEKDCLGRVNEAFQRLDEGGKVALLQADAEGQWLRMDGEGNVGEVGMDKGAPPGLVRFLQLEVGLRGYVSSGSVGGQGVAGEEAELRRVADGFTWSVEERQMELTAY